MGVRMNLRIITKNMAAGPEIRFPVKSISKPYGRETAMPPAWDLTKTNDDFSEIEKDVPEWVVILFPF